MERALTGRRSRHDDRSCQARLTVGDPRCRGPARRRGRHQGSAGPELTGGFQVPSFEGSGEASIGIADSRIGQGHELLVRIVSMPTKPIAASALLVT